MAGSRPSCSDKGGVARFKQLVSPGSVTVTVPLATEPVHTTEPVLVLRQLLTAQPDTTGRWAYLPQNLRDNQATVVAPGTRKPTSRCQVERIENRSHTIAHLSEPIARQDLDDAPALRAFVDSELRLGVELALESEIVSGDGTGEHFTGIAHMSGIQVQPFDTDHVRTLRRALTLLEDLSLNGTGYVMSRPTGRPSSWP